MPTRQEDNGIDKTKTIMGYKVNFRTEYDEGDNNGEYIKLIISLDSGIKSVLKRTSTSQLEDVKVYTDSANDRYKTMKRYKIKTLINNSLPNNSRNLIYLKELVDAGEVALKILDIDRVVTTIQRMRAGFQILLETFLGIQNISQEVVYGVRQEEQ